MRSVSWTAVAAAFLVGLALVLTGYGLREDNMKEIVAAGVIAITSLTFAMLALRDR